jgi:hypothetical protein
MRSRSGCIRKGGMNQAVDSSTFSAAAVPLNARNACDGSAVRQ